MLNEDKRIKSKAQLKEWLDYELGNYGRGNVLDFLALTEPAILKKHQRLLRKTEYYTNINKNVMALFYRIRLRRLQHIYGLHVPLNCCAKGLKIMHLGSVLMNDRVTVGENCAFHINTSLVAGGVSDDVPTLGNGVVVGVGAVILGGVHVADNVAIGANAVVNRDILEQNIAVAGVPAKKVSNNGRLNWNKKETD